MATIVFNQMAKLVTDYIMGASGTVVPPSSWTLALSTTSVGSGANMTRASTWSVTVSGANINEIGSTTPAGYARVTIARTIGAGGIDWIASSLDPTFATGGSSTTADQVTFSFSGAPSPGTGGSPASTNSWVMTDGSTLNASTSAGPFFAADTAAPRTFGLGDTEKVTATLKAG